MPDTLGSYLRGRYRWALGGIVGGGIGALLTGSAVAAGGAEVALQGACAVIWGGALVVAAATRCPRCRARLAQRAGHVLPLLVQFAVGTPARHCPRCGVSLEEPAPRA